MVYSFTFPKDSPKDEAYEYIKDTLISSPFGRDESLYFKAFKDIDYEHIAMLLLKDMPERDRWAAILDGDECTGSKLADLMMGMATSITDTDRYFDVENQFKKSVRAYFEADINELITDAFYELNFYLVESYKKDMDRIALNSRG
jgi:hypothetical protein